ncbi:uncharacterized protein LOC115561396 [Gadus morhua]|uniref:uncharacterized protein LOC115561396 n=1 Tax=Gadus morhua TaxID=8049 RepID=UPI0011B434AE|nr:uncharacterized protein LOC115561396 [Gadus morhua]
MPNFLSLLKKYSRFCALLPILYPTVPLDRQQCVLKATKEARAFHRPKGFQASAGPKDLQMACDEAKRRCRLVTTTRPSKKLYLGQLVIPFGKYAGQSFMWLVANDVGYLKYLLDRHIAESQDPGRTGGTRENDWVKDCLLRYVEFFPSVSCHLEKNVDRAIYGQGRFKSFTFQEMWQWYSLHKCLNADPQAGSAQERKMAEEAFSSVRQWLGMKEEDISSKALKRFRRFILDKEKQKAPTAAVPSSSLSGPVPSETVVPPSASVVPPSASASASVAPPTATSLSPWHDTLFSEALTTFEGQVSLPPTCLTPGRTG